MVFSCWTETWMFWAKLDVLSHHTQTNPKLLYNMQFANVQYHNISHYTLNKLSTSYPDMDWKFNISASFHIPLLALIHKCVSVDTITPQRVLTDIKLMTSSHQTQPITFTSSPRTAWKLPTVPWVQIPVIVFTLCPSVFWTVNTTSAGWERLLGRSRITALARPCG